MMLKDKVAVIYGAGGAIGGAVARGFAAEGARLFLTGRHRAAVEAVAAGDACAFKLVVEKSEQVSHAVWIDALDGAPTLDGRHGLGRAHA